MKLKLTKTHLRKIINEELQEITRPGGFGPPPETSTPEPIDQENAQKNLVATIGVFFSVEPDEAQDLLAELEDIVYWRNKNKPQTDDDEPYDIDKETRHVDAMGKPFSGPGSAPEDFGPLHPKYKK